jgi:hypothetical protein
MVDLLDLDNYSRVGGLFCLTSRASPECHGDTHADHAAEVMQSLPGKGHAPGSGGLYLQSDHVHLFPPELTRRLYHPLALADAEQQLCDFGEAPASDGRGRFTFDVADQCVCGCPNLHQFLSQSREADVLVVGELGRVCRFHRDVMAIMEDLAEGKTGLRSLNLTVQRILKR